MNQAASPSNDDSIETKETTKRFLVQREHENTVGPETSYSMDQFSMGEPSYEQDEQEIYHEKKKQINLPDQPKDHDIQSDKNALHIAVEEKMIQPALPSDESRNQVDKRLKRCFEQHKHESTFKPEISYSLEQPSIIDTRSEQDAQEIYHEKKSQTILPEQPKDHAIQRKDDSTIGPEASYALKQPSIDDTSSVQDAQEIYHEKKEEKSQMHLLEQPKDHA
eukprot:1776032-Ditylum_brightwellii.AAC.1